jgi:hypothetical protein
LKIKIIVDPTFQRRIGKMVRRKILVIALAGVMVISMGGKANAAAPLVEENFNAADISTYPNWVTGSDNDPLTQLIGQKMGDVSDPGTGDLAVLIGADGFPSPPNNKTGVRVQYTPAILRGMNKTVRVTIWGDTVNAWGDGIGGNTQKTFPQGFGFHGPLHYSGGLPAATKKVNDTVHAGFNGHDGYAFAPMFRLSENGQDSVTDANGDAGQRAGCEPVNGVVPDASLWTALTATSTKANAVILDIELGDTAGFKPSYSTDGGTIFNDVLTLAGAGPNGACNTQVQNVNQTGGEIYDTRVPGGLGLRSSNFEGDNDGTPGAPHTFDGVPYETPACTHTSLYFALGAGFGNSTGGFWFDDMIIGDNAHPVPVELSGFAID